jgi:hypothetical protein
MRLPGLSRLAILAPALPAGQYCREINDCSGFAGMSKTIESRPCYCDSLDSLGRRLTYGDAAMSTRSTALWIAVMLVASFAEAGDHGSCTSCGCHCGLKPVCRLVCEMKEVTEWCYDCKCEDFCVPGPSKKCGEECQPDCTSPHGKSCHTLWQPSCGKAHQRTLLIKYPVKKLVPAYRCEVVHMCDRCCHHCGGGEAIEPLPGVSPELAPPVPPAHPHGGELQLPPLPPPQHPLPPPPRQSQRPATPLPLGKVSATKSGSFLSTLFGAK